MKIVWGLVIGISILHYAVMGYAGDYPSREAENLMSWAFALMLAYWCLADAKRRGYHRPYEFGAFLFLWPVVYRPICYIPVAGVACRSVLVYSYLPSCPG